MLIRCRLGCPFPGKGADMHDHNSGLALELLVNHVLHLRSQVEILQEVLHRAGVVSPDAVEREVEDNWTRHGAQAVDAFWDEVKKLGRSP